MTTRKRIFGAGFAAAVLLLALPLAAFAGTVRLGAHLQPGHHEPQAAGAVLFEARQHHHHQPARRLLVAVQNVASTDLVAVLVNGHFLDLIELDHTGAGHLVLSTAHGDHVPALGDGAVIQVVDAGHGHALLLQGTLRGVHHP